MSAMQEWSGPCPQRGPGLGHAHWALCEPNHSPKHALNQCCHCGVFMGAPERIEPKLTQSDSTNVDPTVEYPPELAVLVEPQRRTKPATEKPGTLTDDDKNRLRFYINHVRPHALGPEPVEPKGEYADLFRRT